MDAHPRTDTPEPRPEPRPLGRRLGRGQIRLGVQALGDRGTLASPDTACGGASALNHLGTVTILSKPAAATAGFVFSPPPSSGSAYHDRISDTTRGAGLWTCGSRPAGPWTARGRPHGSYQCRAAMQPPTARPQPCSGWAGNHRVHSHDDDSRMMDERDQEMRIGSDGLQRERRGGVTGPATQDMP